MERRGFIKALAGGAVGWLVTSGATTADAVDAAAGDGFATPVPLAGDAVASGVGADRLARLRRIDATRTARLRGATFPQSVASGDPRTRGIVLWTRVDPAQQGGDDPDLILWQVSTSTDFEPAAVLLEGVAVIRAAGDNTVKLPVQSIQLRPYTIYYYRFIYNGIATKTGRFKTLPQAQTDIQRVRLGFIVCQDYSNGYYTVLHHLSHENVDAVIHLGDYIYEYRDDGVGGPNNGPVRVLPPYPSGAQYPQWLADYRHLYQTYRADANLQAVHEQFAMIQLWDDHEFYNDCHQDYHEDTNTPPLTATTPQPALRQAANQAWAEHGLADVVFHPNHGWIHSVRVYRSFSYGKLLDLVVTDERLYRDGPPCGDIDIGERYQTTGCAEQFNPHRTMLGAGQKAWFLNKLTSSTATWKLWANEVMLCQYILQGKFFDLDQWDGYPAERASILAAVRDAGVKNLVVLSGDAHLFLASYLKTDFNNASEAPIAVELMVGAVSSGNYLDAGVDTPAPLSAPKGAQVAVKAAAGATGLPLDGLAPYVLAQNPHMTFWNGSTWGYGILTITPRNLVCEFKVVTTVKQPTADIRTLATFTVPAGQVSLIPG